MQSETGTTASGSGAAPAAQPIVKMSLRPARFSPESDLDLWLKRFEKYVKQIKIPKEQWTGELLPLLDDEPFRVVTQQGLIDSTDYEAVISCLCTRDAPEGNELEWQFKLQSSLVSSLLNLPELFVFWPTRLILSGLRNR